MPLSPHVHLVSCSQMARKDVHFDNSRDTLKSIGTYQTASEVWRLRLRKTVVIQRFWRGFSARSRIWALHQKKWAQQAKKEKAEQDEVIARERRRQREIHQRMNPTTVRDFEVREQRDRGGQFAFLQCNAGVSFAPLVYVPRESKLCYALKMDTAYIVEARTRTSMRQSPRGNEGTLAMCLPPIIVKANRTCSPYTYSLHEMKKILREQR